VRVFPDLLNYTLSGVFLKDLRTELHQHSARRCIKSGLINVHLDRCTMAWKVRSWMCTFCVVWEGFSKSSGMLVRCSWTALSHIPPAFVQFWIEIPRAFGARHVFPSHSCWIVNLARRLRPLENSAPFMSDSVLSLAGNGWAGYTAREARDNFPFLLLLRLRLNYVCVFISTASVV
jgi:hypothetical protein